jgi:hypothetical protein
MSRWDNAAQRRGQTGQAGKTGKIGGKGKHAAGEGDLATTLASLEAQDSGILRTSWQRLYRTSPPDRISQDLLVRAVAYRLQELALGGLRPAAKRKLVAWTKSIAGADSAGDAGAGQRHRAPAALIRLKLGATLIRTWHGVTHSVQVDEDGFEHQGICYASLTHIAQVITGTHWSGPRFFGLAGSSRAKVNAATGEGNADASTI